MPLLQPLQIPRTNLAQDNPFFLDTAVQGFYPRGSKWTGYEVIPPDNKWSDGTASFMAPARHYHLLQTESFHIAFGSGYWYLAQNKKTPIFLEAGQDITIPRFIAHTFKNASKTEPLVIQYRYDAQRYDMERRFFYVVLPYLHDCKRAKFEPSLLQLCVILTAAWMPPDILWVPGGEYVRCMVSTLFMWIMAAIGWGVYGYRANYKEYYDERREDGDGGWLERNFELR